MKLSLDITKTGNHALDILDPAHNIEAVILEKKTDSKMHLLQRKGRRSCILGTHSPKGDDDTN